MTDDVPPAPDRPSPTPAVGDTLPDGSVRVVSPPVVYLPCRLDADGALSEIMMVRLDDGRAALMAYSALDRLGRACGDAHPWVLWETERLDEIKDLKHFDAAYLDVALPRAMRLSTS
ncbi:hypothetical protein GCM10009737_03690 [Nocardioides lentus]|uniref:SseB protein N-terminal domain-containing protein n=1 Tax=Nocardioides lentus TaxID=338077 RepID=A0ABN2NYH6_9ACTN